ncbi:GTPase IMAP family member 4-like [Haliotis rufescens]|uniref:GTPase IMAP family member 4-like n=1 Tax=Haliotis rufescens TaxID=6454 RepID=UPI00201E80A5|nr:GTPase IMAP family member 4-like [Haliotis rufescens]
MWVCQRCFELNDKQDLVCKKCHHTRGEKDRKEENVPSQGEGLCPQCNVVIDVSTGMCQNCSMKNVSVARIEPFGENSGPIEELRMVLLGKTGAGKSATANTILNEHVFPSRSSLKAVTDKCQYHRRERFGKIIQIVDTPGLFDTNLDKTMVEEEIKKCIAMSTPGPHAFLMVVSFTGRFTQEDTQVFKSLDDIFGKDMKRYMIIVFTNKDMIERDVGEHIEDCPDTLKEILGEAKGGYITFNNRGKDHEKDEDVKKLLDGIDIIVKSNEGGCFTSETFREAEEVMQSRIMEELERKKEEMMKEVEEEVRKEMEEEFRKQKEYFERLKEESDHEKHYLERELASEKRKSERLRKPMGPQETTMEKMKLQNVVQREVKTKAEQDTIIRRIQRSEGSERARMQQKLSALGSQVKQIVAEKKQAEEAAIVKRYATNVDEELPKLRNMERQAIQRGEEETIGRYKRGMKKRGMAFLNFFRQILP